MTDVPAGSVTGSPAVGASTNRDFALLWVGETVSLYGAQVTSLAVPLTAVVTLSAGAGQVGLLRFLQLSPYLLGALPMGYWADRGRRRPLMLTANLARMVLTALIPVLAWAGLLSLPLLLLIAFVIGWMSMVFDVSWMAYVPSLLRGRTDLAQANARLGIGSSSADAAGPALGGALITAVSAPTAMVLDSLTYAVSVLTLWRIRTPEPRPERPPERRLAAELKEGLVWVFGDTRLRYIALLGFACNFFTISISSVFVLYAVEERQLSATALGAVFSVGGASAVLGSVLAGPALRRMRPGLLYRISMIVVFVAPALVPLASGPIAVQVAVFGTGIGLGYLAMAVANVLIITVRQSVTPDRLLGRMSAAIRMLLFGGGSLGGLAAGGLGEFIGLRPALIVLVLGSAAMVVPVLMSPVGRLRSV